MSFNLKSVKLHLQNTVGVEFTNAGFIFNKTKFQFSKKIGDNKVRCFFMFYDYSPRKIEYSFAFVSQIKEIEQEKEKYYSFLNTVYKPDDTLLFREGDFHPKVQEESLKLRSSFTHILTNAAGDAEVTEETIQVLQKEFFPRLTMFCTLSEFQKFILADYNNAIKYVLVFPALLAIKLYDCQALNSFIEFLKARLEYDKMDKRNIMKQMIDNVVEFSNA